MEDPNDLADDFVFVGQVGPMGTIFVGEFFGRDFLTDVGWENGDF